ncbi:MAG: hypothetical protein JO316_05345 [Abitibacteriaceae bacterium]|nr:hypothetical protein [Abditibacteriaceae bacterium]
MDNPFVITTAVRFLGMGVMLAVALYLRKLPRGDRRILPAVLVLLLILGALAIWEMRYLHTLHEGPTH